MMRQSGASAVVKCLESEGVDTIFGMIGHGNLALYDALNDSNIRLIAMPHEQLAAHAADGYYRASHKTGVVTASIGPGLVNTLNGVLDAVKDCSAMVVIAGDTPTAYVGRESFQEVSVHYDASQLELLRPIVKRAWQVRHPAMLTQALARAFNYANSGRPGPVLVDVAFDIFSMVEDFDVPDTTHRRPTGKRVQGDAQAIVQAAKLLWQAQRPLLYAGNGVLLSEASTELQALAEYLGAPIANTMSAPGVIRTDHSLYGGFTGVVGSQTGNWLAQNTDVVLAIGTRLGEMDCNSWRPDYFFPVPQAKVLQVDIEPTEIGKVYEVAVGIVGDAGAVLQQLLAAVRQLGPQRRWQESSWVQELQKKRMEWEEKLNTARYSDAIPLELARVIHEVSAVLPPDGYLLGGVGPRHLIAQQFPITQPGVCILNNGHGTMGFSPPAALGVKLAHPDCPVINVVGDGEFRSVCQVLAPAVEHGINVVWLVLNNYGFNIIELYQKRHYERLIGSEFKIEKTDTPYNPDFKLLAEAYGAGGITVNSIDELQSALRTALAADKPYVLDVRVTRQPRIMGSGQWDANRLLPIGFNLR
ncbi:MAG: thiamine pyrophosphate-binding protein [Caldilinea sp. CFX5]|nr:thiamine pyrophosphate-binding protein [Caldilinea sp. CFX5]